MVAGALRKFSDARVRLFLRLQAKSANLRRLLKPLPLARFGHPGLKHKDVCIISNNCIATYLYKDFGVRYSSPTINLQFTQDGFVAFCRNFDKYVNLPIVKHPSPSESEFRKLGGEKIGFPVGLLGNLTLFLQHYETVDEANAAWKRRAGRINRSKIVFIFMAYDSTPDSVISAFDALPLENKLILTNSDRRSLFPGSHPLLYRDRDWYADGSYWSYDYLEWINSAL